MNVEQRPLCLYHKNCLDGIASAWVAWKFYRGNIDLQAIQYGDPIPVYGGRRMYVLDFSFKAEMLMVIDSQCDLVLLDHHDTAAREFEKLDLTQLRGHVLVDEKYSGAMLAWRHFFPEVEPPIEIQIVQDRDLWKFEIPYTREWTMAAFSYPFCVEEFEKLVSRGVDSVCNEGHVLERKQAHDVDKIAKNVRTMKIDGHELPVINANVFFVSDLGHKLSEGQLGAVVYTDGIDGRVFSLRSREDGMKVNELAERFGGGGHPGAAGFKIKFKDRRFKNSHLYLRSKGYWWRRVKAHLSALLR